jgi:hypothetical protein
MGRARICSLLCAAVVSITALIAVAPQASADAEFVGGGAAGVQIYQENYWPRDVLRDPRGAQAIEATPAVELPWNGGDKSAELLPVSVATSRLLPVTIQAARVRTFGNLQGYPYADSAASVGFALSGTDFVGVRARCTWDRKGSFATTEVIRSGGKDTWRPGVNTRVELPGLGYAVLNEQFRQTLWNGAKVISVNALRIHLTSNQTTISDYSDIVVGFASCDPLNVPSVGGVRLVPGGISES